MSRVYKAGSIIYFMGDKADTVFVLQSGLVSLSYISPETQMEVRETIKNGEFFGVKSALGRFPREETAQVIRDATVMALSVKEFEELAVRNHKLVMKMLKVFSNQLRRIGKNIQIMLDSGDSGLPGEGLFRIGEYYLKNKKFKQALHAYSKYLEFYAEGEYAAQCHKRIEMASSGAETGYAIAKDGSSFVTPLSIPDPEPGAVEKVMEGSGINTAKQYYQALSFFSQNRSEDALGIYQNILNQSDDQDGEFVEKSLFDMGRCLLSLNRPQEAVDSFTQLIQRFSQTQNLKKALFHIGEAYVQLEDRDKAVVFFKKVQGMPPQEPINKKAAVVLTRLEGG